MNDLIQKYDYRLNTYVNESLLRSGTAKEFFFEGLCSLRNHVNS